MHFKGEGRHWTQAWDDLAVKYVFQSKRGGGGNLRGRHSKTSFVKAPPDEHVFEKQAEELTESACRGYDDAVDPLVEKGKFRPAVYPVCWGWNAGGRSGNATSLELREPRLTHKSGMRQYIGAAAGTHHSLLVSDECMVYSFGEGRHGQLGYGNDFMHQPGVTPPKGGLVQTCPRAVTPSGNIQFGHDLKISQVACGTTFSVAREMTTSEGAALIRGLKESEDALRLLKQVFYDAETVQWAWSNVRQERHRVNRVSEGRLTSWGTGAHGELGLGQHQTTSPRPQIIPRLRHINIAQIAAGKSHVLAISSTGLLYSWGSGRAGKLGHGDWEDRFTPLMVKFFEKFYVEFCAAGDAHSAVLTTNRKGGARDSQLKRVSTFGRGAHGRLGNNSNWSSYTPVPVTMWPPSLEGAQFHSLACGGAHTLALASLSLPKTKANPWGIQTVVLSWGYGSNGQLGTGYCLDSFVPCKARLPRAVIIAEVAAGKSWSVARSIGGELFTWGKGLRGQLGQGRAKFSFAPRKVKTFASFVKLGSGQAHNVCLSAPKKFLNPKLSLGAANQANVLAPLVPLAPKQQESHSLYTFDCCRRHLGALKSKLRFICRTCNISSVCHVCAKQCHRNHDLAERRAAPRKSAKSGSGASTNPLRLKRLGKLGGNKRQKLDSKNVLRLKKKTEKEAAAGDGGDKKTKKKALRGGKTGAKSAKTTIKVPFCKCGMFNSLCRVIPMIPEGDEGLAADDDIAGDSNEKRRVSAAISIQRLARLYNERQHIHVLRVEAALVRFEVVTQYWNTRILKQIWARLERSRQKFREERELQEMAIEEATRKRFEYFYALQTAVGGMDAMVYATKALVGTESVLVPRVDRRTVSEEMRPSFAFTWASVRQQQLNMHPSRRVPVAMLVDLTKNVARFDAHESLFSDPDVTTFCKRFLRDANTERFRIKREAFLEEREAAKKMREERARAALMAMRFASKAAVAQASALTRPMPPSLPPSLHVLVAQAAAAKAEKKKKEREVMVEQQALEDAAFDMFGKTKKPRVFRRNSIAAPEQLYHRHLVVQERMPLRSFSKRRNSLPANCKLFHPTEVPTLPYVSSIIDSLGLFYLRDTIFDQFLNSKYSKIIDSMRKSLRRRRLRDVLGSAGLNPRLPLEMTAMITDGYRRRTVAEPERLAKQLHIMFESRNKWEDLRVKANDDEKMTFRRRSFDLGEITDEDKGITEILGYQFEDPYERPKTLDLRKDSSKMERLMSKAGFLKSAAPTIKSKDFGAFLKREIDEEQDADKRRSAGPSNRASPNKRLSAIRAMPTDKAQGAAPQTAVVSFQVWQEHYTEEGATYYYCPATGVSTWEYPVGVGDQILNQYHDPDGNLYWYNSVTGDSFYE